MLINEEAKKLFLSCFKHNQSEQNVNLLTPFIIGYFHQEYLSQSIIFELSQGINFNMKEIFGVAIHLIIDEQRMSSNEFLNKKNKPWFQSKLLHSFEEAKSYIVNTTLEFIEYIKNR